MNLPVDKDGDVLFCTVKTYKLFLAHGRLGMEALELYMHLMFTARLQQTNKVKAADRYLMNGLQIGEKKLRSLKLFLKKLGLIKHVQDRGKDGQVKRWYVQLNFLSKDDLSTPADSASVADPATVAENHPGGSRRQMLKFNNVNKKATPAKSAGVAPPAAPARGPAGSPPSGSDRSCKVKATPEIKKLMSDLSDRMKQGNVPDTQLKLGPFGEIRNGPEKGRPDQKQENSQEGAAG